MRLIRNAGRQVRFDERRRAMAVTATLGSVLVLWLLSLLWGCASAERFPRGYNLLSTDLRVWQNPAEGFSLTLVSSPDRAQGFAEWGRLGIYGRIVGTTKSGSSMDISLGDGGMNGLALRLEMKGNSIVARCVAPPEAMATLGDAAPRATVTAELMNFPSALRVSTAKLSETQGNGRDLSMRLQYLSSRASEVRTLLDEALRRGQAIGQMAAFRRAQQEGSPVVVYDQSAQRPPLIYEEVQYPVFVSRRYVSVATQRYLFNGGAHGAASTDFDVVDLENGARLGPDELLREGWREALLPALSAELLRQGTYAGLSSEGGLKSLGLFEPALTAPDKVFVCMNGLGFEYDRYQIAPWAMGEYIVLLPWDQVTAYLKDAIKPF